MRVFSTRKHLAEPSCGEIRGAFHRRGLDGHRLDVATQPRRRVLRVLVVSRDGETGGSPDGPEPSRRCQFEVREVKTGLALSAGDRLLEALEVVLVPDVIRIEERDEV